MKSQDQFRLVQVKARDMIQLLALHTPLVDSDRPDGDLADAMDRAKESLNGVVRIIEEKIKKDPA